MSDLGKRLTRVMKMVNIGDKQLAKSLSVSPSLIGQWRRGARIPSDRLWALCQCLGVNAHWLLFGEGSKEPPS